MSNSWDMSNLRRLAGLQPLSESKQVLSEGPWYEKEKDNDDDEDRDARVASSDKRQAKFEKRNRGDLAKGESAAKKAESKAPAKPDAEDEGEKKAEPTAAAEAKRRGKAPNESSFNQQAKKYAREHSRATFIKWAADTHGKGKNYASALFAKYNPKSSREVKNEAWIIVHPHMNSFTLAENIEANQLQWIDASSPLDTMVFATEAEAQKVSSYMNEWKNMSTLVEHIEFDLDE